MSKFKINYSIKNEYDDINSVTKATLKDEVLYYKEEDKTKVQYNYDNRRLERTNDNMSMVYDFKEGIAIIDVKTVGSTIKLKLESVDYQRDGVNVTEKYKLEDEIIEFRIEVI